MSNLSVLLPTYNNAVYINSAVKSILNQSYKNFELIIVDDGSTDDTESLIKYFSDSRIKYFKKTHSGLADSLNYGLNKCNSQIIARMDADDICLPNWLEKEFSIFKKYNGKKIISCGRAFFKNDRIKYIIYDDLDSDLIKKKLLLHSYISHPGVMYNKEIILNNGGYKGDVYEDYDLWLRLRNQVSFHITNEVLIFMRFRNDSLSRKKYSENHIIHYNIQEPYYKFYLNDFGLKDKDEEYEYRAWREYFYGESKQARYYWKKMGFVILGKPKISIAFLFTFFPKKILEKIIKLQLRYRLNYFLNYFSFEARTVRKNFKLINKNSLIHL